MKNTTRRIINFRFDRYEDIENKLEKMAAKGLFLQECGSFLWTFKKGAPQKLKYAIAYFSEGSMFNPDITDNQQTYFDYAAAAGWNYAAGFNQMHIFSSEADNPIPFETDENEKFNNIKKCMRKSFLPFMFVMILVFMFNLIVQFNSFRLNPIAFLSDSNQLFPALIISAVLIYEVYSLIHYFVWCKRSEKSIESGGGCSKSSGSMGKAVDIIFAAIIGVGSGYFLLHFAFEVSWFGLLLSIAQMPILMFVFWSSIKYLRKKKASATINKVVSSVVLISANFLYLSVLILLIIHFGFSIDDTAAYRKIAWPVNAAYSHEYKLYSDKIPLTCEDLYGETGYAYYSYERNLNDTFFLSRNLYRQDSLPARDAPPRIEYEILEPKFDFVYQLAREQLLEIPEWRNNTSLETVSNEIFNTVEGYQRYFEGIPTGEYILFYKNRILVLYMQEPPTEEQALVIKEKLSM